jgi:hypothetical protein
VSGSGETPPAADHSDGPEGTDGPEAGLPLAIVGLLGGAVVLLALVIFLRRR